MTNQNEETKIENENKNLTSADIIALKQSLLSIQINVNRAIEVLNQGGMAEEYGFSAAMTEPLERLRERMGEGENGGGRIIEGVFNGEEMIGPDKKSYSVPANYASKSKLVEGDILKLTINARGNFVYKQIGPIDRERIIAVLGKDENGFFASAKDKKWRLLPASVTYFKGESGDETVILIPKDHPSRHAAVENIIKVNE